MKEVRHADAQPAWRRCAPQPGTASQVNSSARLSQPRAEQGLGEDKLEPPWSGEARGAVMLARRVE